MELVTKEVIQTSTKNLQFFQGITANTAGSSNVGTLCITAAEAVVCSPFIFFDWSRTPSCPRLCVRPSVGDIWTREKAATLVPRVPEIPVGLRPFWQGLVGDIQAPGDSWRQKSHRDRVSTRHTMGNRVCLTSTHCGPC